jgi:CubicO group peptidase (beta-lactamase class C family)
MKLFALSLALVCSAALSAQSIDSIAPATKTRVDRTATQVLETTGVPSASIAIVKDSKVVYTHAYGKARLSPELLATPDMRYSIGSVSKQFTAAAILLLAEDGKLYLDDAVGKYIPGLTRGNDITIRQILSHTSGYQDYYAEDYTMTPMRSATTAQFIIDTWAKKPLDFEPGTQWQYSNTNFVIAGRIVEVITGHPLMDFITTRIFHPLGMKSVWNSDEEKLTSTDALGYARNALAPLRPSIPDGHGWMYAAGELAMTAHDLALWDISLMNRSLLKPESYNQMFTEVKLKDGKGTHYGLGVEVIDRGGHLSIEHSGEVSGFVSDNVVLVNDHIAIVALTNQEAASAASTIARYLIPLLTAQKPSADEQLVIDVYRNLQQGKLDRSLLAPNLNDFMTAEAVEDFRSSLAPLGDPLSFKRVVEELRGGMTFRAYRILYPGKTLTLTTYFMPDGKLEQFIIESVD